MLDAMFVGLVLLCCGLGFCGGCAINRLRDIGLGIVVLVCLFELLVLIGGFVWGL